MNFNLPNDPLGLAVMARGAQSRDQQHMDDMDTTDINSRQIGGPLPDPMWDGLLQAMKEHHVGHLSQDSYTAATPSTANPEFQQSAEAGLSPSTNIANSYQGHLLQSGEAPAPIRGLRGAASFGEGSEPGHWGITSQSIGDPHRRGAAGLRVEGQKGTDPMNNSQRFRMPGGY